MPVGLRDVRTTLDLLKSIGCEVQVVGDDTVVIDSSAAGFDVPHPERSIRTTILFAAPLLARFGRAVVPEPGGDAIGARGYDLHRLALERLGAHLEIEDDLRLSARAEQLRSSPISFPIRTMGGTETAILAAVLADGTTEITNAHTRPEVRDLIRLLRAMGARIELPCASVVLVEGVTRLHGAEHTIMGDPIEGFTYLVAGAMSGGRVQVAGSPVASLEVPLVFLRETGVEIVSDAAGTLTATGPEMLGPVELAASAFPGVESDLQPLFLALATQAEGTSRITDLTFPERFQYAEELARAGVDVDVDVANGAVVVHGPTRVRRGASLRAPDIRGGAALALTAAMVPHHVRIDNWSEIERGYVDLDTRLRDLGAMVT